MANNAQYAELRKAVSRLFDSDPDLYGYFPPEGFWLNYPETFATVLETEHIEDHIIKNAATLTGYGYNLIVWDKHLGDSIRYLLSPRNPIAGLRDRRMLRATVNGENEIRYAIARLRLEVRAHPDYKAPVRNNIRQSGVYRHLLRVDRHIRKRLVSMILALQDAGDWLCYKLQ